MPTLFEFLYNKHVLFSYWEQPAPPPPFFLLHSSSCSWTNSSRKRSGKRSGNQPGVTQQSHSGVRKDNVVSCLFSQLPGTTLSPPPPCSGIFKATGSKPTVGSWPIPSLSPTWGQDPTFVGCSSKGSRPHLVFTRLSQPNLSQGFPVCPSGLSASCFLLCPLTNDNDNGNHICWILIMHQTWARLPHTLSLILTIIQVLAPVYRSLTLMLTCLKSFSGSKGGFGNPVLRILSFALSPPLLCTNFWPSIRSSVHALFKNYVFINFLSVSNVCPYYLLLFYPMANSSMSSLL